jgi:hypothetical protein
MNCQKIIVNTHHHLWTDALHARALAHQALNKWDRGTYVRWAVTTSWTVLEVACQDALNEQKISYSFQKNLDAAIEQQKLAKLDWGSGLWQQVKALQETRKEYVHRFRSVNNLFPEPKIADQAIEIVRKAVKDIYQRVGSSSPAWIQDDNNKGWDKKPNVTANLTLIRKGASGDPNAIKICYISKDEEHVSEILPSGTDYKPYVDDLIQKIIVPITAVKVYEGQKLVDEIKVEMRGN